MKKLLYYSKSFFEKMDTLRDKVLFIFIKPYWPKHISPNQLTVFRIIIGIFLFVMLFFYKNDSKILIISLFCVGAITDLLDGSVARGLHKETSVGALLDPAADRILIIPIAVYSLFPDHQWLLLWLIILEIINALASIYGYGKNVFVSSNIFGKIKMVLQSVVFGAILIFWPKSPNMFFIYILWFSVIFLIISIYLKALEINEKTLHEK